jgi:hypothetical protein
MRFVDRTNERELPVDYCGDVCVWDIDKTYLDTRFSSLRGLLGIPFDMAIDKRAEPGAVALLRGLRRGGGPDNALVPLYFLSGSPRELRGVLERKMTLDDVQYDGIAFKDHLGLLKAGRPGAIKEQVGYKLKCLLALRSELPMGARFLLFGDDVERDLEAFLLFGQVCAGLRGNALRDALVAHGVKKPEQDDVIGISSSLSVSADPVAQVFIHEVRGGRVERADPRVYAAGSFFQHALVLRALGKLTDRALDAVQHDVRQTGTSAQQVAVMIEDAVARHGVPRAVADAVQIR